MSDESMQGLIDSMIKEMHYVYGVAEEKKILRPTYGELKDEVFKHET